MDFVNAHGFTGSVAQKLAATKNISLSENPSPICEKFRRLMTSHLKNTGRNLRGDETIHYQSGHLRAMK
jgi:hypothetical protein